MIERTCSHYRPKEGPCPECHCVGCVIASIAFIACGGDCQWLRAVTQRGEVLPEPGQATASTRWPTGSAAGFTLISMS